MEQGAAIKVTKSVAHSCAILIHSQIFNIKIVPSKEDIIINDLFHSGGKIFPPLQLPQCLILKHGLSKRKQIFNFFFLSFFLGLDSKENSNAKTDSLKPNKFPNCV
jgi:hypothetical protein